MFADANHGSKYMNRWTRWIIASSLGVVWASGVSAERVEWKSEDGGNGHAYKAVVADDPISAADAHQAAEEKGGHLATITSRKENDFVFKLVDDDKYWGTDDYGNGFGPWIGGRQDPDAKAVDAGWRWVTGEEWKYTNWSPGAGEPNDGDEQEDHAEDCMHYFCYGSVGRQPQWNDSSEMAPLVIAYVIEWTPKEELAAKKTADKPAEAKPAEESSAPSEAAGN
jgi:hypothetical protein